MGTQNSSTASSQPRTLKLKIVENHDIQESYLVQLANATMDIIDTKENDLVLLKGSKKTNTVCRVQKNKSLDEGVVCMNRITRNNLRSRVSGCVLVEKLAEVPNITYLYLSVIGDTLPADYKIIDDKIRTQLMEKFIQSYFKDKNIPIHQYDMFQVQRDTACIEFMVSSVVPKSYGIVNSKTNISLALIPIKRADYLKYLRAIGYDDIGGYKKEIGYLREVIEVPLSNPELFLNLGIKPPRGVLLYGPPGTGKTLLARAVCNESRAYFAAINGPEILSMFFGGSEANLRSLFERARSNAPSIIFMDELDAIAPSRDEIASSHGAEKSIVAQLLTLMDGLVDNSRVVVIGATNRLNTIDPALRRGGRFDREIFIGVPSSVERLEILQVITKYVKLNEDVNLEEIAEDTHGFVGADLALLCTEAALHQIGKTIADEDVLKIRDKLVSINITMEDFKFAMQKVGPNILREHMISTPKVTWKDIGGLIEVKKELQELIQFPVQYPEKFKMYGLEPTRGMLFFGPPGCGKTLLAQAVAGECKANFISIKGPELLSKYFGESCKNVRNLFNKARAAAPCVLFFDELDSVTKCRGSSDSTDSGAADRVTNQILTEMDGMSRNINVFVIAATNRPDIIDPALLRPGRLDQIIYIPLPDEEGRLSILRANLRNAPLAENVNLRSFAKRTSGYSGADLTQLCQRACKLAIRESIEMEVNTEMPSANVTSRILNSHFEKAFEESHRSVSDEEVRKYEQFAESMGKSGGSDNNTKGSMYI